MGDGPHHPERWQLRLEHQRGAAPVPDAAKGQPRSKISKPLAEYPHKPDLDNSGRRRREEHHRGLCLSRQGLAEPLGVYVYGDYDTGRIWGLREQGGQAVVNDELIELGRQPKMNVASFGEDPAGELYILAFDGKIYRLVPRP